MSNRHQGPTERWFHWLQGLRGYQTRIPKGWSPIPAGQPSALTLRPIRVPLRRGPGLRVATAAVSARVLSRRHLRRWIGFRSDNPMAAGIWGMLWYLGWGGDAL